MLEQLPRFWPLLRIVADAELDKLADRSILDLGQAGWENPSGDLSVDLCCVLALCVGVFESGEFEDAHAKGVDVDLLVVLLLVELRGHELCYDIRLLTGRERRGACERVG